MKKVKDIFKRIYQIRGLKYIVTALIAVIFIGFVDENSAWKHFKNRQYINELQDEINKYTDQYNNDKAQIKKLDSDPKSIEKIARERYFMKTDEEDIFVLSDDDQLQSSILSDEPAE